MKRIIALLAAAAFVLSLAGMASAGHQGRGDLGTSGYFQFGVAYMDNTDFQDPGTSSFVGDQRFRQFFDYIASDNLRATVGYDINSVWGSDDAPVGADEPAQIELKRANLSFTWPGTETQIMGGIDWISLPGVAMGYNPVLAGDMAGVVVTTPVTEAADLTLGWTRGYENQGDSAAPGMDTLFATMPVNMDGYSFSPFAAYTMLGKEVDPTALDHGTYHGFTTPNQNTDLNDSASAWWLGTSFDADRFDPVGVRGSFIYGSLDADREVNERSGWYADLAVDYQMPSMTPEVFAMYSSGEDDDPSDGSETMPMILNDASTTMPESMMIGDLTTLGITSPGSVGNLQWTPLGLWTAGVRLKHIQLVDRLSSNLLFAYYQGTNDENSGIGIGPGNGPMDNALTEEDSAWEITVANNYEVYENLSAVMEAGYAALDMDDGSLDEPATRVALGMRYSF